MSQDLYLEDSYLKECDAVITSIKDDKFIVLNRTIFYPKGGGQPHDTGKILRENDSYNVEYVGKFEGTTSHEIDRAGLKERDRVHCIIDWERRYKLMRNHTAAHTLAALLEKETGALITGNQLEEEKVRFDFSLEDFDRELFQKLIDKANALFKKDIPVKWYELPKKEAMQIPSVIKLANVLPPNIPVLRIVEIQGLDKQADGGTHVKNLNEIGAMEMIKAENKGKNNRRVYFRLIN